MSRMLGGLFLKVSDRMDYGEWRTYDSKDGCEIVGLYMRSPTHGPTRDII